MKINELGKICKKSVKIFGKTLAGFKKVATFASAIEKQTKSKDRKITQMQKKVLKNLVVTKKGLTFVPTLASENAAIFLAPLRKERNQKRFFDLLV